MDQPIPVGAELRIADGVMACELGDGLALLHHDSGTFFTLDDVGSFIWTRLSAPATIGQITDAVTQRFDAQPQQIDGDVRAFVASMVEACLLQVDTVRA